MVENAEGGAHGVVQIISPSQPGAVPEDTELGLKTKVKQPVKLLIVPVTELLPSAFPV